MTFKNQKKIKEKHLIYYPAGQANQSFQAIIIFIDLSMNIFFFNSKSKSKKYCLICSNRLAVENNEVSFLRVINWTLHVF